MLPETKKTLGIILITIMSAIQLLLLFMVSYDFFTARPSTRGSFDIFFTMLIFAFPLFLGIKLYRDAKADLIPKPVVTDSDVTGIITIVAKIQYIEYRNLTFRLLYTNPAILFLNIFALTSTFVGLMQLQYIHFAMMGLAFLVGIPLLLIRQTRRNFSTNSAVKETITYTLDATNISVAGDSSQTLIAWSSLYKVKELKGWFLLYVDRNVAHFVPKRSFQPDELIKFRNFAIHNKKEVE
jgi:YcxB-like protein